MKQMHFEADQEMEKQKAAELKVLLANPLIRKFMRDYGCGTSFIEDNVFTFKHWLKSLEACTGCTGAANCRQPLKGKVKSLGIDETGYLYETYVSCQYEKKQEQRLMHADRFVFRHGNRSDLEIDFDSLASGDQPKSYLMAYLCAMQSIDGEKGLYLYGQPGVGKTWMFMGLANKYAKQGTQVAFVNVPQLMSDLKENMTNPEYRNSLLVRIRRVPVLFLDDIGSESISKWTRSEVLFTLLEYRMSHHLKTYFSSNYQLEELQEQYVIANEPNSRISALRLIERIRALSNTAALTGKSRRV